MNHRRLVVMLLALLATSLNAQSFKTLYNFSSSTNGGISSSPCGHQPFGGVVLDGDTLYGTTSQGGVGGSGVSGTIFSMKTDGTGFTVLHTFDGPSDGRSPQGSLVLKDGTLYGVTLYGGADNYGTIYSVRTNGSDYTRLYNFSGSGDGANPTAGLQLRDGTLFGTTALFTWPPSSILNTVFRISTNGAGFAVLHTFNTLQPGGKLVLDGDMIYGLASGAPADKIVFSMNTNGGNFTILHTTTNGPNPMGMNPRDIILKDNMLLVTAEAGDYTSGILFSISTNGSNYNLIRTFTNAAEGLPPCTLAMAGNSFYVGAHTGGQNNYGTVMSFRTNGEGLHVPRVFTNSFPNMGGGGPIASLLFSDGILYGTTPKGGTYNLGTLFSLNLAPTLQSRPPTNNTCQMTWTTMPGAAYQLQYCTNLAASIWQNLGAHITATTNTLSASDSITNSQRVYRVIYQP